MRRSIVGLLLLAACGNGASTVMPPVSDAGTARDAGPTAAGSADAGHDAGPTQICGNGAIEDTEQCDLGTDNGAGHGCTDKCRFECAGDADCSDGNPCNGAETCVASITGGHAVQKCAAGVAAPSCASCSGGFCDGQGACKPTQCGDGCLDTTKGEQCDFGTTGNAHGSGCEVSCLFSCALEPGACTDGNVCNGVETCGAVTGANGSKGQACASGPPKANDATCGNAMVCEHQACVAIPAGCGDGTVGAGEQCDLGALNGTGQGCSAICQLDCSGDADCSDGNSCNGAELCVAATVSDQAVKKCQAGTPAAACSACAAGVCNLSGQCAPSVCGDGCLDATAGEQCDDGNRFTLDGCDAQCKYEMVTRMTGISISGKAAPAFCTPATNYFGTQVLTSTALGQINPPLQTNVDQASVNILMQFLNLADLTGASNPAAFNLGILAGGPDQAKGTWPGNSPLDWWFLADHGSIAAGLPTGLLTAKIVNHTLTAGPNDVTLSLNLAGSPADLRMRSAQIAATINSATSVPAPPPDALAAGLKTFQSVSATATGQGLCGNITVESLAAIPVPESLTSGTAACATCTGSNVYTYCGQDMPVGPGCNSLLDVIVGGCKALPFAGSCVLSAVNASQPDVPAAGGAIKTLTLGADNKVPADQTAGNQDAFSAYLQFSANRAHLTGENCTVTADCRADQICVNKICE